MILSVEQQYSSMIWILYDETKTVKTPATIRDQQLW